MDRRRACQTGQLLGDRPGGKRFEVGEDEGDEFGGESRRDGAEEPLNHASDVDKERAGHDRVDRVWASEQGQGPLVGNLVEVLRVL
jgi:hypothetical protein